MGKIVRVYFSTFIDIEADSDNFANDEEMKEYYEKNLADEINMQDVMDNLAMMEGNTEVF